MAAGSALFWVLVVVGTALVVAAAVLYARRRRDPSAAPGLIGSHEVLMYLNEAVVMDILQYRDDVSALKRQVEKYTRDTTEGRGEVKTRWLNVTGGRTREGERAEFFEVVEQPITAIRKVVRHLEAADAIVYADFHDGEVHAHHSLVGDARGGAALSDTRMFLSVVGVFEVYEEKDQPDADYLRLRVPYPGGEAHARVKFPRSGLRKNDVLPQGNTSFGGRVLGKVESWDEEDRVLKMWALAIFR
ncbi:hypothetical protein [Saccharothrix sp. Mg75]|uniref:hypothetical protein n=1 Tax=Saccharothrix sp. Mg75 TaxID=3445357 RepID=UPI003EF05286